MPMYRRKPTTIEAFQWTGDAEQRDDPEWIVDAIRKDLVRFNDLCSEKVTMVVTTIHGDEAVVRRGDWVAREPMEGRFYPIRDDIFRDIYELVESTDG